MMQGRDLVAWNLRRLRTAHGLSQEGLARATGIDRAYLSALETAQGNATVDLLQRIATVVNAEMAEFFIPPPPDAARPQTLPAGRKPKSAKASKKAASH